MNFRNPELQRLLDSLKEASRTSTQDDTGSKAVLDVSSSQYSSPISDVNDTSVSKVPLQSVNNHPHISSDRPGNDQKSQPPTSLRLLDQSRSRSTTPSTQLASDASIITTWPAAVKHVTKTIVSDDQTVNRIKHLMSEQHKHEEQWWTQREAIVAKHNGRADNNTKVADLLKELGGLAMPIAKVDQAADKNELETFDKKVYKSLVQMTADFDSQLRKLGVPFYAIKHDLVISSDDDTRDLSKKGKLDRGELRDLQTRMLQYLEDLLMDE